MANDGAGHRECDCGHRHDYAVCYEPAGDATRESAREEIRVEGPAKGADDKANPLAKRAEIRIRQSAHNKMRVDLYDQDDREDGG